MVQQRRPNSGPNLRRDLVAPHLIDVIPHGQDIYLEHHVPMIDDHPYHTHPSIEINYLRHCDMTYSFSGQNITIPQGRLCIFWAAYPHRSTALSGQGVITNSYVSLQMMLDFALSAQLVELLLSGAILCSKKSCDGDRALFDRLAAELGKTGEQWRKLHRQEIHARLTRLDVEGWEILKAPSNKLSHGRIGGNAVTHFDKMLRYISRNAFHSITVKDVADAAGISSNHAIVLFRKMLGTTIKAYLLDLRLHHAKMMLIESNEKILNIALDCGFGSLSSFYDAFGKSTGVSPATFRASHISDQI